MPRCACGAATCACEIIATPEDGIEVTGRGSQSFPYRIKNLRNGGLDRVQVIDSDTIDLTFTNLQPGDPNAAYSLQADATIALGDLTDVDGADVPATGDVLTWDGTQWVFSAGGGGGGVPPSGVWGTAPLDDATYGPDSLRGIETYVDSAGKLRARPQVIAGDVNVNDSPSVYPTGLSIMGLSAADGVALGWGYSCTVVTYRRGFTDSVVAQWLYQNHTPQLSAPNVKFRSGNAANNPAWSTWAVGLGGVIEPVYHASRGHTAAMSIPAATQTVIPWDTKVPGTDDSIPWNGTAFVIPVAGYYTVEAMVTFTGGNSTGSRNAFIRVNGSSVAASSWPPTTGASQSSAFAAMTFKCAAGDLVDVSCQQTTAGALTLYGNNVYNRMSIVKVPSTSNAEIAQPRTARRKSASQALTAASTWYNVTFDVDVETNASIPYSNGVFTAPSPGVYQINVMCLFGGLAANAQQRMRITVDGAAVAEQANNTSYAGDALTLSKSVRLTAGQAIAVGAWVNITGGNITGSSVSYTVIDITRVSA